MSKHLTPFRRLGNNKALTPEDWRSVYLAQQAFLYQVRRIVDAAEARHAGTEAG